MLMCLDYDTRMNQLIEWAPLVAFFLAYEFFGIYWATAALMLSCVLLLVGHRLRTGKFKTMHLVTTAVVLVLGSATLLWQDKRFIQWKPTVLLGLTAIVFLGSALFGPQPLARRMFENVFNEPLAVAKRTWLLINSLWAAWFALLAFANIYIAQNFAEGIWVKFKVFGITVAMLVFMIPQVLWMSGKTQAAEAKPP